MKLVVTALMESVSGLVNVSIVIFLIWLNYQFGFIIFIRLMFAILGLNLMREKMGYCHGVENYFGINKNVCDV